MNEYCKAFGDAQAVITAQQEMYRCTAAAANSRPRPSRLLSLGGVFRSKYKFMENQMAQHRNVGPSPCPPDLIDGATAFVAPPGRKRRVGSLTASGGCPSQAVAQKRTEVEKSLAMLKTLIANRVKPRPPA